MRKYLGIIKIVILEKLQYIPNRIASLIIYAIFIFLFLQLWQYMYSDDGSIAGYSLNQMVWYVAMTEIVWFCVRAKSIRTDLSMDIKSGKIAYVINKPFNYIGYLLAKYIGEFLVSLALYLLVGIPISFLIIGSFASFKLISIPFILLTIIFASLITAFIYILISLTAFWFEENSPFFWVYEKLILAIGVLFPIEIFPNSLQPLIRMSPVYVTTYAPAKMFVDFSYESFLTILLSQVIYLAVVVTLSIFAYKKGVKKLSVNGG